MEVVINQTVAILCDGNNIERSIKDLTEQNSMINFDTLIPRLLNGRGLNRLIYFREGKNISSKLAERLHEQFYGSVVPCHKSADIPLSIKATQLASKVDTIIILSGDSDYVDLVRHLRSEGVRVEIAAVEQNTARILKEEADYFHPITKEDCFIFDPNRSKRPTRHEENRETRESKKEMKSQKSDTPKEDPKEIEEQTPEPKEKVSPKEKETSKEGDKKTIIGKLKSLVSK